MSTRPGAPAQSAATPTAVAQSAVADREIVISRVIDAPREPVFEAFTEVRHLSRWWGPEGFTTSTRSFEFRVGGAWDYVMHGPDGTDYQEWITWTEIAPPERIALLHGESRGDPNAFESVTPGNGRAGRSSTSSTTASSLRSTRPARPPATGTFALRAAAQRFWST